MPAQLRRATSVDTRPIAELIRASKAEAMPWLRVPHTLEEDYHWAENVLLGQQSVWVAEHDGRLAGVLAVHEGWLEQLYIASDAQRLGIGRQLVAKAKELSPMGLQLWAFNRNERARRFYERAGFSVVLATDGAGNEEREPDVLYAWAPE